MRCSVVERASGGCFYPEGMSTANGGGREEGIGSMQRQRCSLSECVYGEEGSGSPKKEGCMVT